MLERKKSDSRKRKYRQELFCDRVVCKSSKGLECKDSNSALAVSKTFLLVRLPESRIGWMKGNVPRVCLRNS